MVKWLHDNTISNEILIVVEGDFYMPNWKDKVLQTLLHRFPLNRKGDSYHQFDYNVVSKFVDEEHTYKAYSVLFIAVHINDYRDARSGIKKGHKCKTQAMLNHLNVSCRPEILQLSKTLGSHLPRDAIKRICLYLDPKHFRNNIKKVDICSLSFENMAEMWRHFISEQTQYIDEDGGRCMAQRMWKWLGYKVGWSAVREY